MRPGSLFLNLSRGFVVDQEALRRHLESGHLAGAGLDVFPEEPKARGDEFLSPLRGLPNVILTPHIGSNTAEANARMAARALHNIRLARAGDYASMDLLNREVVRVLKETGNRNQ